MTLITVALLVPGSGCQRKGKASASKVAHDCNPGGEVLVDTPGSDDTTAAPQLLVVLVLDQLGSWTLQRHRPHLSEDGFIAMAAREGGYYSHGQYDYAGTYTAAGHASIQTGTTPAVHGIVSNWLWDPVRGSHTIVNDGVHGVFGEPQNHVSPTALQAPTLSTVLKQHAQEQQDPGQAVAVALSWKDRAAAYSAGRDGDLALWFSSALGEFTTSTYYAQQLPDFLTQWHAQHPLNLSSWTWEPQNAALLLEALGPDAREGESNFDGLGNTFPYALSSVSNPASTARIFPQASTALIALAKETIRAMDLGKDRATDLLTLSISATDYVGHAFGPLSWEYLDTLIRVDAELGAFARELSTQVPVTFALTSDHGVAPIPEPQVAQGEVAGRADVNAALQQAEQTLVSNLGDGPWIAAHAKPFIHLTDRGRDPAVRDTVVATVVQILEAQASVHRVLDSWTRDGWANDPDEAVRRAAQSIHRVDRSDLFVIPTSGFLPEANNQTGTTHGTPWSYDSQVPILLWGQGVQAHQSDTPVDHGCLAASLAAIAGVPVPMGASRPGPAPEIRPLPAVAHPSL